MGDFFSVENLQLARVPCDELRVSLYAICDEALQTNTLSDWNAREELHPFGLFESTMLVLCLAEETRRHVAVFRANGAESIPRSDALLAKPPSTLSSASEMARDLLGRVEDIVVQIPSYWRILHVEEILRRNLATGFYTARDRLREQLQRISKQSLQKFQPRTRRRGDIVDDLAHPVLTFHSTARANVPSIVRRGLLKPGSRLPRSKPKKRKERDGDGEEDVHGVRCGSIYRRGIDLSPNPAFALSYSGTLSKPTRPDEFFGLKFIPCATLMGRTAQITRADKWWLRSGPYRGADSHVGNDGKEYVVFEKARILPVYVLHFDWGDANEDHLCIPPDPSQWSQDASERA